MRGSITSRLGRRIGRQEPTHREDFAERSLHARCELGINPHRADHTSGSSCFREHLKCGTRMGTEEQPGVESAPCNPRRCGFSFRKLPLALLHFRGGDFIGRHRRHHLCLQLGGL